MESFDFPTKANTQSAAGVLDVVLAAELLPHLDRHSALLALASDRKMPHISLAWLGWTVARLVE